jgi:hypothetical protein
VLLEIWKSLYQSKIQYDDWALLKPYLTLCHTDWTAYIISIMIDAGISKRFVKLCQIFNASVMRLLAKLS